MPLGIYISVPFCRTKCSYCNFASDVFSKAAYENYVNRLVEDIRASRESVTALGCTFDDTADSVYLGGGTPSILEPAQLLRVFGALRAYFKIAPGAEVTVECAPGTLSEGLIDNLLECGVTRVSLGVQSFVDREAAAVGRLHSRTRILDEIEKLRRAGLMNINIDLIAGLPHQTLESWTFSVQETIATGAPHVSVYMLEIDEDSRLGRELMAGGTRYHAHFVPDDGATADFYLQACDRLEAAGIRQYEISNFACAGGESTHNLKYWTRQPYLGLGVDAHSMMLADARSDKTWAIRFSTPDALDAYMNRQEWSVSPVVKRAALEEAFFLGLRLNRGLDLSGLQQEFDANLVARCQPAIERAIQGGLLEQKNSTIRLTSQGRLMSNEVFQEFLADSEPQEGFRRALHIPRSPEPPLPR